MKNLILRYLNGRIILPLFISTGVIYTIMLAITIPAVMSFSGGMKILDMMPAGYDSTYVNTLLKALGEEGRHTYLYNQIPFDLIFPLLFGITFCLIYGYVFKLLGKTESTIFYTFMLPVFSGLFDYCENICIIKILNSYPDNSDILTSTTSVFSVLKSTFTTITFTLLIVFLITLGIRKVFGSGKNKTR